MKRKLISILFVAIVLLSCICTVCANDIPASSEGVYESLVEVEYTTNFGVMTADGIFLNNRDNAGYVLLPNHIISAAAGDINIKIGEESYPAQILEVSKDKDICVIKTDVEIKDVKKAKFRQKNLKEGSRVYVVTRNYGKELEIEAVSSVKFSNELAAQDMYKLTESVSELEDGAAVVNKLGEVEAVAIYSSVDNADYAITSASITDFLQEKDIPYKKADRIVLIIIILAVAGLIGVGVYLIIRKIQNKKNNAPMLVGVRGEFEGQEVYLTAENVNIGRDASQCQVVILGSAEVSRCHCSVRFDSIKNDFILTDLASTHGTFLMGGEMLEPKLPVHVCSGTEFYVGTMDNIFKVQ